MIAVDGDYNEVSDDVLWFIENIAKGNEKKRLKEMTSRVIIR